MTSKEVYRIWAPANAKWTDWVRPVPFVAINYNLKMYETSNFSIPEIEGVENFLENAAIIVDMPGLESIKDGLALAKLNFIPIPVYNGTTEQDGVLATTDNRSIVYGLLKGATVLKNIQIKKDAMPAFLLDTNRMNSFKMEAAVFDNSWDIYDQDLPSSDYLLNNGVEKILVISSTIQRDLKKILYKYQKKGIKVFLKKEYEIPKLIKIKKPKKDKNE